jgi:hypothetical protein
VHAHRAAALDPQIADVGPGAALAVRVGYGDGEQLAEGEFAAAVEVPYAERRRRGELLRPQERVAEVLGGKAAVPACELLVIRARADVDAGRRREAALQLEVALVAALAELEPWAPRGDLAARLDELRVLRPGVQAAARSALQGGVDDDEDAAVRHALERLEAALRARTALGFD